MTLSPFDGAWLERFHRGERASIESCYRVHFTTVEPAIGTLLTSADRETVIHELFSRLISQPDLRRSFQGRSLGAWLARVARNQAIDYRRRQGREVGADGGPADETSAPNWEASADARLLIARFKQTQIPAGWLDVFEVRFLQQLPQREAARRLGIRRTTLAYRELRIRRLLRKFLVEEEDT